jgi:hypothetical protein
MYANRNLHSSKLFRPSGTTYTPYGSTKSSLIDSLRTFGKHNGFKVDDKGSLKYWYKEAMDEGFWKTCLERYKARDPNDRTPPQRPRRTNHHSYNTRSSAQPPPPTPPRNPPPSPPREPREPPRSNDDQNRGYDPDGVGYNLEDSLGIFNLEQGVNWMEIKAEFKRLSRLYHPDKHNPARTNMTTEQAKAFFQLFNNAKDYLHEHYRQNGHI